MSCSFYNIDVGYRGQKRKIVNKWFTEWPMKILKKWSKNGSGSFRRRAQTHAQQIVFKWSENGRRRGEDHLNTI